MLESVFNEVASLGMQLYYKETQIQLLSCECCKIFKNSFFIEHLCRLLLQLEYFKSLNISTATRVKIKNVFLVRKVHSRLKKQNRKNELEITFEITNI